MKVLGIDFGTKRIGLALADLDFPIANKYGTILVDGRALSEVARVVRSEEIGMVVLGLPKLLSGAPSAIEQKVRKFAESIKDECGVVVQFVDERYSSRQAEGNVGTKDKSLIDAEAARIILQTYLDHLAFKNENQS